MNKNKNKIRISFYVEGEVEVELINLIRKKYLFHKICTINKATKTNHRTNIKHIIKEVIKRESDLNEDIKTIIILIYDQEVKILKTNKAFLNKVDYIHISNPSIDFPLALSLGIKVKKNTSVKKIKKTIQNKINFFNKNYLDKKHIEKDINFNILFNNMGRLGMFFKRLIRILEKHYNKSIAIDYKTTNEEIVKLANELFRNRF